MENVQQTSSATPPPAAVAPSSANVHTAGAIASSNAPGGVTTATRINSMEDLKRKAPELYQKMLEGIGMSICGSMRDHQERLKKLMREGRQG